MTKFAIRYALAFIILIPAQAIIFNHAVLFNVAIPLVFLYLIVSLPISINTNLSVLLGFLTGFFLDIFMDTLGVNALSCTIISFARKPLFHLYVSLDDDLAGRAPSSHTMGAASYMKYMLTIVLLYSVLLFTIEAFQLFSFKLLLLRIITTTLYTFVMLYALDSVFVSRRE